MTSTSFNVGLKDGKRLSSRVLRPPGGGHTDIFGGEPEPTRGRRPAASIIAQSHAEEPAKPTNGAEAPTQNGQASEPQEAPPAPAPASPVETKSDSPKAVTPTETLKADAPKRVRVPPGGFSSGLW